MKKGTKIILFLIFILLLFTCTLPMAEKSHKKKNKKKHDSVNNQISLMNNFNNYDLLSEEDMKKAAMDEYYFNAIVNSPENINNKCITVNNPALGDVNANGIINLCDALLTARYSLGYPVNNFNTTAADVNMDGMIDLQDAIMIAKYYKGIISQLPDNILKNGLFDNGVDNWFLYSPDSKLQSIDGNVRITINNPGANIWDIGFGQNGINIESGCTYKLSFKVKSDNNMKIKAVIQLTESPYTSYFEDYFDIKTGYSIYSTTFIISDTNENATFVFQLGGNNSTGITIDNVILEKKETLDINLEENKRFVHAKGQNLVVGKEEKNINLRGVCFTNNIWNIDNTKSHHNEIDYQRIKNMGMNVIRFYINYKILEDDSTPYVYKKFGWDWIDQNIIWAKKYGIYLIINIHMPQGGYQPNGEGFALWDNIENQNRFTALWREIARKYKNEKIIAGYDLLNEPLVSTSVNQWRNLAQRVTNEIRKVDKNHLVIIERLMAVGKDWQYQGDLGYCQFLVDDPYKNVMYDFHFYKPEDYTHQLTSWTLFGEGGVYPDENLIIFPSDLIWLQNASLTEPMLAGSSDWKYFEGPKFKIDNSKIISMKAGFETHMIGTGVVYFDDLIVREYDPNGNFINNIQIHPIENNDNWGLWTSDGSGKIGYSSDEKHSGNYSFYITGTNSWAACYNNNLKFVPKQGYMYSVGGYTKSLNLPENSICQIKFDVEISPSGSVCQVRNKEYLRSQLLKLLEFGKKNNVPMNVGEFGTYIECFKNNKGGLNWVNDIIDLMIENNLNFTYHTYHEYNFGLYQNNDGLPNPGQANNDLINLLTNKISR